MICECTSPTSCIDGIGKIRMFFSMMRPSETLKQSLFKRSMESFLIIILCSPPWNNIAPENRPPEKEIPIENHHFCLLLLLVLGSVRLLEAPASHTQLSTAQAEMSYVRSEGEYRHAVSCFKRVKRLFFVVKVPGQPEKSPKITGDQWINLIKVYVSGVVQKKLL